MFSRKSVGVSISSSNVVLAHLSGTASSPLLERVSSRSLSPGTVRPLLRDRNILNPQGFVIALKEARAALQCRGRYVSLSLPDSAGRVMMLEMEERFKNRSEGLDLIRWKLRKKLPFDTADAQLDYQHIRTRENGDIVLLVALVLRPVITQYEELFEEAGMIPTRIDLDTFNLCRVFERRLEAQEEYALLTYFESNLGILFFSGGKPEFVRIKETTGDETDYDRLRKEIRFSFLAYKGRFPEREFRNVFCFAPPRVTGMFRDIAGEAIGLETVSLEMKTALTVKENPSPDPEFLFPFTPAIGAAIKGL